MPVSDNLKRIHIALPADVRVQLAESAAHAGTSESGLVARLVGAYAAGEIAPKSLPKPPGWQPRRPVLRRRP